MSYEVNIFFGEDYSLILDEVVPYMESIIGGDLRKNAGAYEANCLALEFDLSERPSFLVDSDDMPFSTFKFQLSISCRGLSIAIIHPVALMLTEILSNNYKGKAMLCLSFTEFLGAVYRDGKLLENRFSEYPGLFAGSNWSYEGR